MRKIAVVCNNRYEWDYFVDTLQWKLSKENKPYKTIKTCIVDIDKQTQYIYIPCSSEYSFEVRLQGMELNDYILMCGISDEQLAYLNSKTRVG